MQSFLLKHLTKLGKINLRGSKEKKHTSQKFSILILTESSLHFLKTFRIQTFKKSVKNATKPCYNTRIISSDLKPEVDASLNITCQKVMITYCITKSYRFKIVDSLVLKLQDTETETLKPHYIHVYKLFG